eukprot:TRINITY_DN5418_c0_g2_i18.p1 TRINITY_DN5418_c0_g2~~TRINITY_DN5418_c0_g2_i18.p1  ORF type:complete len:118 (+),score=16.26 TRINITY_DN5418_c0_g2_i18:640-993(+)
MTTSRQPTSRDLGSLQNLWPYPRSIKFLVTFPPDDAKNLHPTYIKHVLIASQQSEILWQDMYYLKKIANFMKFCTDEDLIREWEGQVQNHLKGQNSQDLWPIDVQSEIHSKKPQIIM